jgi:hypothetical protein
MIYDVPHTLIDVFRSYVPFWLPDVVGADLRPDIYDSVYKIEPVQRMQTTS